MTGGAAHPRKACRKNCTAHKAYTRGCPKPCPRDCTDHAKACPGRTGGGQIFRSPRARTSASRLSLPLISALRAHRAAQNRERLTAGELWEEHDRAFCQANGRPIDPRADYAEWQDILEASGVQAKRVHDGRHTAGTLLTESGVGIRVVMELLGHSQMRVTQRYTHVGSPLAEDAAAKMGDVLWG
ncbi:tyrosine-type recombinase/integrase [Streptomyces sp. ME03-5709C]|nr:tyrosine-type recombinase/integrase [Streptomyces sp. ME03-5709C]